MSKKEKECCPENNKRIRRNVNPGQDQENLARIAKALGHPIRLEILTILKKTKGCICGDLVDQLPLSQATVSQHLKVLKKVGLIRGEIRGPSTCYCLEPISLRQFKMLVKNL
ncbi:MAG: winged helix-turn-helix transcriptional regulator [Deltaproteobacteria bacterium]|nr:winged helix-turn-helix transcriptional regulator [Deltaproteobacteria bacterium]